MSMNSQYGEYHLKTVNGHIFRYRIDTFMDGMERGHVWYIRPKNNVTTFFCTSTAIVEDAMPQVESIIEQYSRDAMLRDDAVFRGVQRKQMGFDYA